MPLGYLLLTLALVMNSAATILLKIGSAREIKLGANILFIKQLLFNVPLVVSIFLFATNVICYFLALKLLPLSVAYPIMIGGGFLIINTFALVWFKESISLLHIIGFICILAGIVLVSWATK